MKIVILGDPARKSKDQTLIKKANDIFEESSYIPIDEVRIETGIDGSSVFFGKKDISDFTCVFPIPSSQYIDIYFSVISVLSRFETYLPYSVDALINFHKRVTALYKIKEMGLPVERVIHSISNSPIENIIEKIKFPVQVFIGSKSAIIEDENHLKGMLKLRRPGQGIYIQKVPEQIIGCLVVGDDVIASVEEHETKKRKKLKSIGIGENLKKMAIRAVDGLGSDYGYVIIDGVNEKIIDVSLSPDFSAIEKATAKDISKAILVYMKDSVREVKESFWDKFLEFLKVRNWCLV